MPVPGPSNLSPASAGEAMAPLWHHRVVDPVALKLGISTRGELVSALEGRA
jgi:hypothetical protein